jgi:hypothetical protein
MSGETRQLRYDTQRDNMAAILFPGEQHSVRQQVPVGHRNVTSLNHPFLSGASSDTPRSDAHATGRRVMRGPPDTNDLLSGPADDAPAQQLVGVSASHARQLQQMRVGGVAGGTATAIAHPADHPELRAVAGARTRRDDSMGTLLFGGAAPTGPSGPGTPDLASMAHEGGGGKRRGPINYQEYQVRVPRAAAAPLAASLYHERDWYGLAAPAERAALGGGGGGYGGGTGGGNNGGRMPQELQQPREPPPSQQPQRAQAAQPQPPPPQPPDALDELMIDARFAELRTKYDAVASEVQAVAQRDAEGNITDISQVADALRRQVCACLALALRGLS